MMSSLLGGAEIAIIAGTLLFVVIVTGLSIWFSIWIWRQFGGPKQPPLGQRLRTANEQMQWAGQNMAAVNTGMTLQQQGTANEVGATAYVQGTRDTGIRVAADAVLELDLHVTTDTGATIPVTVRRTIPGSAAPMVVTGAAIPARIDRANPTGIVLETHKLTNS
jgi:hypothetical protein